MTSGGHLRGGTTATNCWSGKAEILHAEYAGKLMHNKEAAVVISKYRVNLTGFRN